MKKLGIAKARELLKRELGISVAADQCTQAEATREPDGPEQGE